MNRRELLTTIGGASFATVAGCLGIQNTGDEGGGGTQFTSSMAASHYPGAITSLPVVVAQDQGFFEDNNISMEDVNSFTGGGTTIRGITTGGLGIGVGAALPAVINAFNAGAPIQLVSVAFASNTVEFDVLPDSEIETIQDCVGKRIALSNPGGTSEATAIRSIQNADGITLDDVEFVYAGGLGEALTATREGEADVSWHLPPSATKARENGEWRLVWRGPDHAPNLVEGSNVMGIPVMDDEPELAKGIIKAMIDGMEFIRDNVEDSGRLWAKATDVPEDIGIQALQEANPEKFDPSIQKELMTSTAESAIAQGLIDSQPDWGQILNQDALPEEYRVDWFE